MRIKAYLARVAKLLKDSGASNARVLEILAEDWPVDADELWAIVRAA